MATTTPDDVAVAAYGSETKKRDAPEKSWTWHVCLSRMRYNIQTSDNDPIKGRPLDKHASTSVGWMLNVVRLEKDKKNRTREK